MDSDREEQNYSLDFSSSEESESSKEESNSYLETQELEYSTDLSSTSSGETSSDESLPDVLKPFDFEPVCSPRKDLISESPQSSEDGEQVKRKGNTDWCICGCCKAMETESESFCCRDTNEVPDEYFEGHKCITESDGFKMVCLAEPVLKTALSALNHFRGDSIETIDNKSFRFAGYKQYTFWIYNYLGKDIRKVIPSCSVWKIRDKFKSVNGIYIPFSESKDDMKLGSS